MTSWASNRPRLNDAFRIGPGVTQRVRTVRPDALESTRSPTLARRYLAPVVKLRSNFARLRPSSDRGYQAAEDLIRKKSTIRSIRSP